MYPWSTKDEQDRSRAAPSAVHTGVQAGGRSAGQGRAGSVGDGARAGSTEADAEQLGSAGREGGAAGRRRTTGERRADGAGTIACRAGAREDGARHPKKKRRRTLQRNRCEVRLDRQEQGGVARHRDVRCVGREPQRLLRSSASAAQRAALSASRYAAQQRGSAGSHPSHPRPSQRRIRLAKSVEEIVGAWSSRRQTPHAAIDAHARHQGA